MAASHATASPAAVWITAALLGPQLARDDQDDLESALGCPVAEAYDLAIALLSASPAGAALGIWAPAGPPRHPAQPEAAPGVAWHRGAGPDELNDWAWNVSSGLVDSVIDLGEHLSGPVIASILACRTVWDTPLTRVTPGRLGGQFAPQVDHALASTAHTTMVAHCPDAGLVGVHAATGVEGIIVASVIAHPDVDPGRAHGAALEVVAMLSSLPSAATPVSLFLLPLGSGHAWQITEEVTLVGPCERDELEVAEAVLPPWRAEASRPVADAPGLDALIAGLGRAIEGAAGARVTHCAPASFDAEGFHAGRLTLPDMVSPGWAEPCMPVTLRRATVRFNRPYSVVAFAATADPAALWNGVPLLAAWVGRAGR